MVVALRIDDRYVLRPEKSPDEYISGIYKIPGALCTALILIFAPATPNANVVIPAVPDTVRLLMVAVVAVTVEAVNDVVRIEEPVVVNEVAVILSKTTLVYGDTSSGWVCADTVS
jgi:hypothetical protein